MDSFDNFISIPVVSEELAQAYVQKHRSELPDLWSESFSSGDAVPFISCIDGILASGSFNGALGEFDNSALRLLRSSLEMGFIRTDGKVHYLILPVKVTSSEKYAGKVCTMLQRAVRLISRKIPVDIEKLCIICMLSEGPVRQRPQEVIGRLEYNPEIARRCGLTEEEVRKIRSEDMDSLVSDLSLMASSLSPFNPSAAECLRLLAREVSDNGVYRSYEGLHYAIIFPPELPSAEIQDRGGQLDEAFRIYSENHVRMGMKEITFMRM